MSSTQNVQPNQVPPMATLTRTDSVTSNAVAAFRPSPLNLPAPVVNWPLPSPKKSKKRKKSKKSRNTMENTGSVESKVHSQPLKRTRLDPSGIEFLPSSAPATDTKLLNGWVEVSTESIEHLPNGTWVRYTVPKFQTDGFKVVTAILDGPLTEDGKRPVKSTPASKAFQAKLAESGKVFSIMTWLLDQNKENLRVYIHSNARKKMGF